MTTKMENPMTEELSNEVSALAADFLSNVSTATLRKILSVTVETALQEGDLESAEYFQMLTHADDTFLKKYQAALKLDGEMYQAMDRLTN